MKTATETGYGHFLSVNDFKKMILGANYFFDREKETINALNVFPVPDGDTGTNMSMTLKAAVEGSLNYKGHSIGELSEIVASSALMGARGNSGVILSQILRGIAHGLRKKDHISPGELSKAFQYGVVYAYKAVSKPVEGTILTVAREMARGIRSAVSKGENLYESMEEAIRSGKAALAKTTDMLPALKEAGVVDAGGLGLLVFLEGCLYSMKRSLNEMIPLKKSKPGEKDFTTVMNPAYGFLEPLIIDFPYCTEVIIKSGSGDFSDLESRLSPHGDSLIIASNSNLAKIHIHTTSPGIILQTALDYGTLHKIKIENMIDQHEQTFLKTAPIDNALILSGTELSKKGEAGVISVSFGEGFKEIFLSLGADEIVFGGQTMNPKVEDLLNAVQKLPQQSAIILPNNKNIIMVAEQVKSLTDKQVEVLETRTLPEGLAALLAYNPSLPIKENVNTMRECFSRVKTGLITYATRDTTVDGSEVIAGQFLGLAGEKIVTGGKNLNQSVSLLLEKIIEENHDILTIYYGKDVTLEEASALISSIEGDYPNLEIELHYGGQPIFFYIFSVD